MQDETGETGVRIHLNHIKTSSNTVKHVHA